MSDVPPKKDAIAILMANATRVCPPDDPWYTAVLYEAHLEHVDESEPLWRVPYFGQVVRVGTAEEDFEARKRAHETDTVRDPKDLGFHAVIGMFGADKIEWRVLSSQPGRRSEVQAWANAEEIRLIAEHGGVLRDMDAKLTQTLNLTKGGKWGDRRGGGMSPAARAHQVQGRHGGVRGGARVGAGAGQARRRRRVPAWAAQLHSFRTGSDAQRACPTKPTSTAWAEACPVAWTPRATRQVPRQEGRAPRSKAKRKTIMKTRGGARASGP